MVDAKETQQRRVYVGNLAYSVSGEGLKDFMSQAGAVTSAEVLTSRGGRSAGCAVVEFATPADAERAMRELTDVELDGRKVFVREDREGSAKGPARAPRGASGQTLEVQNLSSEVGWQELKDLVRKIGVHPYRADVRHAERTGTVVVRDAAAADTVISALQDTEFYGQVIHITRVDGAAAPAATLARRLNPAPRTVSAPADNTQLVIFNLPWSTTTDDLVNLFGQVGRLVGAKVLYSGKRSKGQGIVQYAVTDDAEKALQQLHQHVLDGRAIRVELNTRHNQLPPLASE